MNIRYSADTVIQSLTVVIIKIRKKNYKIKFDITARTSPHCRIRSRLPVFYNRQPSNRDGGDDVIRLVDTVARMGNNQISNNNRGFGAAAGCWSGGRQLLLPAIFKRVAGATQG